MLLPVMPSTQQERLSPASFPRSCTSPGPPPRECCFPTSLQHYPNTPIPSSCRNKGPSDSPITVKPASTAPAGSIDLRVALCVVQSLRSAGLCVYAASKLCRSHLSTVGCCALDHLMLLRVRGFPLRKRGEQEVMRTVLLSLTSNHSGSLQSQALLVLPSLRRLMVSSQYDSYEC